MGLYLLRASIFGEEGSQAHGKEAADAFEAAEADYRRALELKPDDDVRYGLLANRGLLRIQSGRLDEAVADLEAAIRLRPDRYQAHTTLGQVLQGKGRLDDAYAAFDRAIACHPEPTVLAGLYRTRALIYASRRDITPGQKDSALRDLEEAIRLEPDKALQASDQVWRARLFFAGGQPQEALAACDAALKLIPDDPEAHRVRISALMELKRYDEVLTSADAYIAQRQTLGRGLRDPRPGPRGAGGSRRGDRRLQPGPRARSRTRRPAERSRLLNRRGWAYQYADATRLALADFEESLRLEPNQGDALGGRGLARSAWASGVRRSRTPRPASARPGPPVPARPPRTRATTRPRPSSTPRGSTPRPSSSRPRTSAARASGPWPSIADIAPAPWTCSTRPSSGSPTASAARRSSMTPRCGRSGSHPVEAPACE